MTGAGDVEVVEAGEAGVVEAGGAEAGTLTCCQTGAHPGSVACVASWRLFSLLL